MIVSIATAVLPVWRSPIRSSRWPRPIGTIASIALRPVWTGWDTDWRQITPGATFSMTSLACALIGPLPSIGAPSELTTRPISSGPTGTERILPVHLTVSPSEMCSYSPMTTAPTESRSRLSARPNVLPGNSSISPCMALERPWMRQMPSVTDTIVPCVRTSAASSRLLILLLMRSEISAGLSCCMVASCSSNLGERDGHRRELAAYRAVDHLVADDDLRAADQLVVDRHPGIHFALEAGLEVLHERRQLRVVDGEGARDVGVHDPFALVLERLEEVAHQVLRLGGQLADRTGDHAVERIGRHGRIAGQLQDIGVRSNSRKPREDARPHGELALRVGHLEDCLGVRPCDGSDLGHYVSSLFRPASICAWVFASTSRRRIFSVPATASLATWSRRVSLARATSCAISDFAPAIIRSPSAFAVPFASSIICAARFSAAVMISCARLRASAKIGRAFFAASA